MVGLNHVFRIFRLLEEAKYFLIELVGARVLSAAMRPHP